MGKIETQSFKTNTGEPVVIRTVQVKDAQGFLDLGKSVIGEDIYSLTHIDEFLLTLDDEKKFIEDKLKNENHLAILAEHRGQIVGQLDFANGPKMRNSHWGEFGMGVHKNFRGLGIGSLLLKALIGWAQSHPKIEKIKLRVHESNKRAIHVYEKLGFEREGLEIRDLKNKDGTYQNTVVMGLFV